MGTAARCVLVTGGAGYIGSHTVLELLEAGYNVVVVDNLINSNKESLNRVAKICGKEAILHVVDLCHKDELAAVFTKHDIYAVIHFAGLKAVGESVVKPLMYYQNNLTSTMNLLDVMGANQVHNLIFSSSATVYGIDHLGECKETNPVGAVSNPYGETKYWIEEMLASIHKSDSKWNIIRLRYFNPIGAHSSGLIGEDPRGIPNNLVPYVLQVAVGRRAELSVFGNDYDTRDGTGVRDYVHVVDLALGHMAALKKLEAHPGLGLATYNLGTGMGYSVLEVVDAMEKASGRTIKYKIVPRREGDASTLYASTKKAAVELDWKATRSLTKMCEDGWRWQSRNPNGYETT